MLVIAIVVEPVCQTVMKQFYRFKQDFLTYHATGLSSKVSVNNIKKVCAPVFFLESHEVSMTYGCVAKA